MLKPTINLQTLPRQSAAVISFILVIACAHVLAKLTWMLVPEGDRTSPVSTSQYINVPANTRSQDNDIRKLAMAHLFGVADTTVADTRQVTTVTHLNLILRGVFAASDQKYGIAIISSGKQGKEEVYGVGDPIPGNATLHAVHPNNVILERNGQLEILKLTRESSPGLRGISPNENQSYNSNDPGEALSQIRRNILRNPISFGDYALPMVIRENGKQIGYRLMPQAKGRELLQEIGLEPSDIITSVNGVKLNDPRNGINALRNLSSAQTVNITVLRNGAEVPLTIQLH